MYVMTVSWGTVLEVHQGDVLTLTRQLGGRWGTGIEPAQHATTSRKASAFGVVEGVPCVVLVSWGVHEVYIHHAFTGDVMRSLRLSEDRVYSIRVNSGGTLIVFGMDSGQ